jgi:hypothetical protein
VDLDIADAQQAFMNGLAEKIQTAPLHTHEAVAWATGRLLTLTIEAHSIITDTLDAHADLPAVERANALLLLQALAGFASVFQDDITKYMNAAALVRPVR